MFQTDEKKNPEPLFLAEIELLEPDIIFRPSLNKAIFNNFFSIFIGLVDDIFKMSELVPRVYKVGQPQILQDILFLQKKGLSANYLETIETHPELSSLREELIQRVEQVLEIAQHSCSPR